ncbi:MAG TPA: T9SS type A sorting domain-containing protein [Chitinophagaceae bacterium]|nr:T9SS type A sorting domain-containing protein [Chitinophagaceae bacterium]
MKKIFTLCSIVTLSLFANKSFAQINENFDNGFAPLQADCWQFTSMMHATIPSGYVINGNGSAYSEPPVSSDSLRIMRTPFLNFGTVVDVSFMYKLSGNLTGQAKRFIKLDLVNSAGVVVQTLDSFNITNAATSATLYSQIIAVNMPGVYRFSLTLGGKTGAGNVRTSIDDLNVNATLVGCDAVEVNKLLPVHLISFQGNMNKNNKVTLNWTVADNEIASNFEVERSFNGRDFTTVGVVFSSEKMGTENYMFFETTSGIDKVMYRLKMIDKNHKVDYSRVLIFQLKSASTNNIKIIGNPINDKLTFSYTSPSAQMVDVKVYDMSGKTVLNNKVNSMEGSNVISLPLSSTFKAGMYVVEVNNGTELHSSKFIKQ